jgi:hypothetical protein
MIRKIIPGVIVAIILVSMPACGALPINNNGANPEPNAAVQTQAAWLVAQTAEVGTAVANIVAATLAAMQSEAPAGPLPATITSTPRPTIPSPLPSVSVSVQTNCRSGPGTAYNVLGILNVGETAQVVGRNSASDYWIIKLPSNPANPCWLWGKYAMLVGNTGGLPVVTPPPTPTPVNSPTPVGSFTLEFSSSSICPAVWVSTTLKITNTGKITWESLQIDAKDTVNNNHGYNPHQDIFENVTACVYGTPAQNLEPGETVNVSALFVPPNPIGHSVTATVKVCSLDGMAGICMDKTITFTP